MPDIAAPVLTSSTSVVVGASANIVLTFSEAMALGNGTITLTDGATQTYMGSGGVMRTRLVGATDTRTFSVTDSQVSISGNTVTINLSADLIAGHKYSLVIASGALTDTAGNAYKGLNDTSKFTVTTSSSATPTATVGSLIEMTDSGILDSDYVTNAASQVFHGSVTGTLGSEEFVQVSLDGGTTWNTAATSGNLWSYAATITGSGSVMARVTNGAASSATQGRAFTFDQEAPAAASIAIGDDDLAGSATTTVTITFSEKVTGLELGDFTVEGGALSDLSSTDGGKTWTATLTPATTGKGGGSIALLSSAVQDVAGNTGTPASASASFSYDSTTPPTAPTATVDAGIAMLEDDAFNTDHLSNIADQTISGTYTGMLGAADYIEVSLDNGGSWNRATVSGKDWSYSGTIAGSGTIRARVSNGTETTQEQSQAYTLDLEAPGLASAIALNDSVLAGGDTATVTIVFTDAVAALAAGDFEVSGGALSGFSTSDGGVTWHAALTPTSGGSGAGSIKLKAGAVEDLAGNSGPAADSGAATFHYDRQTPALGGGVQLSSDTGVSSGDFITQTAAQTISGSFSGQIYTPTGAKLEVSVDNGATWLDAVIDNGAHTWQHTATLSGSSVIVVRLTDSQGAVTTASHSYTIDTSAPASLAERSLSLESSSDTGSSSGDGITSDDTPTVSISLAGASAVEAGDFLEIYDLTTNSVVGVHTVMASNLGQYGGAIDIALDELSAASHQLVARITDTAGNSGVQTGALSVTIDTTAVSLAARNVTLDSDSDLGYQDDDGLTSDTTPTVTVGLAGQSGLVAGDVIEIYDTIRSTVVGTHTLASTDFALQAEDLEITLDQLSDGDYELVMRTTDTAGNTGDHSGDALLLTIDATAPALSASTPAADTSVAATSTITLTFDEALYTHAYKGFKVASGDGQDVREIIFESSSPSNYLTYDSGTHTITIHLATPLNRATEYTVTVYNEALVDEAGNSLDTGTELLAFSTVAIPATPALSFADTSNATDSASATDHITSDGTVTVGGLEAAHWEYSTNNGVSWTTGGAISDGIATFTLPSGVTPQGHVEARQYNTTDNKSASAESAYAITVDTTAPSVAVDAATSALNFFGLGRGTGISAINGYLHSSLDSGDFVEYTVDNGATWSRAASSNGNSWGLHNVGVDSGGAIGLRVSDTAGNLGANGTDTAYTVYIGDGYGGSFSADATTTLFASGGDDTITLSGASARMLDGGNGSDTLVLGSSGQTLSLSSMLSFLARIETIDLGAGNRLNLAASDVTTLAGGTLTINGDSTDIVNLASSEWSLNYSVSGGYRSYASLTGARTLNIDSDVTLYLDGGIGSA